MTTETEYEAMNDIILHEAILPPRVSALEEAARLTSGDRNRTYGEPVTNMQHIADIFNAITGRDLTAWEVATLHRATKLARSSINKTHKDSTVDEMAYAGIAFECALAGDS
jgi:hypothetical protein